MNYRSNTIDPGPWPFRPAPCGELVEQYYRREGRWMPCTGVVDANGYFMVSWTQKDKPRRWKRLHCVVWETYNGPVPDDLEIDHKDMDKGNSKLSNLRLISHQDNIRSARAMLGNWSRKMAKLTDGQLSLLLALPEGWYGLHFLAIRWDISKGRLANIRAEAKKSGDARYLGCL